MSLTYYWEHNKAALFGQPGGSQNDNGPKWWLPTSQIHVEGGTLKRGKVVKVYAPRWLVESRSGLEDEID